MRTGDSKQVADVDRLHKEAEFIMMIIRQPSHYHTLILTRFTILFELIVPINIHEPQVSF